jgi:proteasome lid subunit RPN8/RPN11
MKPATDKRKTSPRVVLSTEVARQIRQHARAHMKTEVCGVLIGSAKDGSLEVEACIAGKNAAQAGTHVTFTQDAWEHIYRVKDELYPEARIVGWYHSHPGFGVFLSDHDTFIHRNFFSAAEQIAWVYDPHSDEEGFFGWSSGEITRMGQFTLSDSRGGEDCSKDAGPIASILPKVDDDDVEIVAVKPTDLAPRWLQWGISALSYVLVLMVGALIAWLMFPRIIAVPVPVDPRTGQPLINAPEIMQRSGPEPPANTQPLDEQKPQSNTSGKPDSASEGKSAR